ncbi:aquaporin PIP2-5-like [Olea europaea var. sylvestris]|uniref:aquaporin PIP2-5-like n=1 Tax=Olea europaea var. sylvestris TaxID=158386 RepID=UPI000C1CFB04|nr:aquaporin PIP2-5-like [Olea europaea var. sylvestris]
MPRVGREGNGTGSPCPIGHFPFPIHSITRLRWGGVTEPVLCLMSPDANDENTPRRQNLKWIFWVGPFIGAAMAALYHQCILRAKAFRSYRSSSRSSNRTVGVFVHGDVEIVIQDSLRVNWLLWPCGRLRV